MHLKLDNLFGRAWPRWTAALPLAALAATLTAQTIDVVVREGLNEPYGVAVDFDNRYYIADSVNNRIARWDPNTGELTNLAGLEGSSPGAVDGRGDFARFYSPQGIVATSDGVIISDSGNHLIRKVFFDGASTTLAGDITLAPNNWGSTDGSGAIAQFNGPSGLAISSDETAVYIADTLNGRIRKLLLATGEVQTVASGLFRPTAVAVGAGGWIYVAETGRHAIKAFKEGDPAFGTPSLIAGSGSPQAAGYLDHLRGSEALFNSPRGLLWLGGGGGLIVSDSGNGLLRRVYTNTFAGTGEPWSVETFGNSAGGGLITPVGLARDNDSSILIVDLGDHALKSLRSSQVIQPPVTAPVIGTIVLTNTDAFFGTRLTAVTNATFNNDVVLGILAEKGTQTYYTKGRTSFEDDIPVPGAGTGETPPFYEDHSFVLPESIVKPSIDGSDVTIKAISVQADRRPSPVITARVRFQTANPRIVGNNPASFTLESATIGAELWYTVGQPSAPPPNPTPGPPSIRYIPGSRINVARLDGGDVLFKVQGYKPGYASSAVVGRAFLGQETTFNRIGVRQDFIGGVGATVIVPVEVAMVEGETLQSLQFRVDLTPVLDPSSGQFLGTNLPTLGLLSISGNEFVPINFPGAATATADHQRVHLIATNAAGEDVLHPFMKEQLSVAFLGPNDEFLVAGNSIVAMLSVEIPANASVGDEFQISIAHPSGTADGVQGTVQLVRFDDRRVRVKRTSYVVGDTSPANWYNGAEDGVAEALRDFGDGDLGNSDVNNVFLASLGINVPYRASDAFDAMDAFPLDQPGAAGGDGQIRFLDWQVIWQRSDRRDPTNWVRRWTGDGTRQPGTDVALRGSAALFPAESTVASGAWVRPGMIKAVGRGDVRPGDLMSVPIQLKVAPGFQLSGMAFRVRVVPEGTAPALTVPLQFQPAPGIPSPSTTWAGSSQGLLCGWSLNAFPEPITGNVLLGHLLVPVSRDALEGDAYRIEFPAVDAAADLATQLDCESLPGRLWVLSAPRQPDSVISPEWRAQYFSAPDASTDDADPDGDGMSNRQEFLAGTDPVNAASHLKFLAHDPGTPPQRLKLRWVSVPGRTYAIESASDLKSRAWVEAAAGISGDGTLKEFEPEIGASGVTFYRVRIEP